MTTKIVSMFSSSLAAFILGLLLSPSLMHSGDPQRADAAFSDGAFQATLDFQSGRKPHLVSGRWNSDRDRLSFVSGYQERWRELFKDTATPLPVVDDAQLTGYWDGAVEGTRAGRSSQPFQVSGGDKGQAAAGSHLGTYSEVEKQHYLDGYAAGYKAGYYARHETKTVASNNF
jgi:hypothetical protein